MFLDLRRMLRSFFFALIALYTCLAALQKDAQDCVHLDQEKAFKVCWTYNGSSDIINFALEVSTLGWIGFGFAQKIHRMQNYDVIVGKIQSGKESLTVSFYQLTTFNTIVFIIIRTHYHQYSSVITLIRYSAFLIEKKWELMHEVVGYRQLSFTPTLIQTQSKILFIY